MAEQELDRTEPATPFKLEEAKRKGQVAKSMDVNSLVALSVAFIGFIMFSFWGMEEFLALARKIFIDAPNLSYEVPQLVSWGAVIAKSVLFILSPLLLMMVIAGVVGNYMQTGPVFSTHPLKPDFKKLNPAAGFKRWFSIRMLVEGVKSSLKLALFAGVTYLVMSYFWPRLMALPMMPPESYPRFWLDTGGALFFALLLAVLVVALIDLIYTRWDYAKKQRMSRREVKEEVKRREGDPHVRAKRKEIQRELRKRSDSVANVKNADVLVTNPVHFAIALKYQVGEMIAPEVIGKGTDELAVEMRREAVKHGVPVIENKKLARRLFRKVAMSAAIPENEYSDVAKVFRQIYSKNNA